MKQFTTFLAFIFFKLLRIVILVLPYCIVIDHFTNSTILFFIFGIPYFFIVNTFPITGGLLNFALWIIGLFFVISNGISVIDIYYYDFFYVFNFIFLLKNN